MSEIRQAFPLQISSDAVSFTDNSGAVSGAVGATALITIDLPNAPFLWYGIRISNIWSGPAAPTADQIEQMRYLKEHVDCEQAVSMNLTQQNILVNRVHQLQVCGNGIHWHPFPTPFPMVGANTIDIEVRRLVAYGSVGQTEILPALMVSILGAQLKDDRRTEPVGR